ncbi:hypothetical protein D9M71_374940 [compost metagenome]
MLRYAEVRAVHDVWRGLIPQRLDRLQPSRIQHPVGELRNVLDHCGLRSMELQGRYRRPGRRARSVVLWVARLFAAGLGVTLAAGGGKQYVVGRYLLPAGLVQVLADMLRVGVVDAMPFNGHRPVVCRPEYLDACGALAGAPSAEAGEQVDCCGHGDNSSGTSHCLLIRRPSQRTTCTA